MNLFEMNFFIFLKGGRGIRFFFLLKRRNMMKNMDILYAFIVTLSLNLFWKFLSFLFRFYSQFHLMLNKNLHILFFQLPFDLKINIVSFLSSFLVFFSILFLLIFLIYILWGIPSCRLIKYYHINSQKSWSDFIIYLFMYAYICIYGWM